MKYAATVLALAAAALAQDISTDIPSCAGECVNVATVGDKIAGCSQGDIKCICENEDFLDNIACCLNDACDQEGKDQAVSFARQICSGAGVEVPDEVVCKKPSGASQTGNDEPEETGNSDDDDDGAGARAVPALGSVAGMLAAMALL
ncbi:hypothetical protein VUR80DRAFT_4197 [Thermomyces stellatus]